MVISWAYKQLDSFFPDSRHYIYLRGLKPEYVSFSDNDYPVIGRNAMDIYIAFINAINETKPGCLWDYNVKTNWVNAFEVTRSFAWGYIHCLSGEDGDLNKKKYCIFDFAEDIYGVIAKSLEKSHLPLCGILKMDEVIKYSSLNWEPRIGYDINLVLLNEYNSVIEEMLGELYDSH